MSLINDTGPFLCMWNTIENPIRGYYLRRTARDEVLYFFFLKVC